MTSFTIKIVAAVSMLLDHAGLILFPQWGFLRVVGRLAFPLFAFCIAEGFYYTRNRQRYFLQIFILGLLCQIVYFVVDGSMYLGVLIVFSLSIILMWALDKVKKATDMQLGRLTAVFTFAALCMAMLALCTIVEVDYGFMGIMLPVLAGVNEKKLPRLMLFSLGLVALCVDLAILGGFTVQWFSLLALPLLFAYNGKPGKYRMKYFFYIFYPAHLAILYLISAIIC